MHNTYRMKEGRIWDEQGVEWTVYGIEAVDERGNIPLCFTDVFFDREKAEAFVATCNDQRVEPVHLPDIISNVLAEEYTVY